MQPTARASHPRLPTPTDLLSGVFLLPLLLLGGMSGCQPPAPRDWRQQAIDEVIALQLAYDAAVQKKMEEIDARAAAYLQKVYPGPAWLELLRHVLYYQARENPDQINWEKNPWFWSSPFYEEADLEKMAQSDASVRQAWTHWKARLAEIEAAWDAAEQAHSAAVQKAHRPEFFQASQECQDGMMALHERVQQWRMAEEKP